MEQGSAARHRGVMGGKLPAVGPGACSPPSLGLWGDEAGATCALMPLIFRSRGGEAEVTAWGFMQCPREGRKGPCKPPQQDGSETAVPLSCPASTCEPRRAVPSGDEMVEERGVPVHEDWSMAPDDDRVRFSLSGVAPHSWKSPWGGQDGGYSAGMGPSPPGILRDGGRARRGKPQADPLAPSHPQACGPPGPPAHHQRVSEGAHLLAPGRGSPPGDPQLRLGARLLVLLFRQDGGVLRDGPAQGGQSRGLHPHPQPPDPLRPPQASIPTLVLTWRGSSSA